MATQREKIIIQGEDQASEAFKKAGGNFDQMGKTFAKVAKTIGGALVVREIAQLGVETVKLASDAAEAASAFETSFGSAAGEAGKFVDEFANKAGFATHELQQMLAVTGSVVQGIGATEAESAQMAQTMATLAGDVASFSNAQGGAAAVMGALQSAINGEREALKTYGIAVSEAEVQQAALNATGKTHIDQLTRMDKAQATVALAYEKAGKAVGDLDRTQDSAANSFRRIAARGKEAGVAVGQELLPAVEELLPTVEALIPVIGDAAGSFAALVAAGAPLLEWGAGWIPDVIDGLAVITNSAKNVGAGIGALVAEAATFGKANTESWQATANNAAASNDLIHVLRELRKETVPGADATVRYANSLAELARQGSLTKEAITEVGLASGATAVNQYSALHTLRDYAEQNELGADTVQMLKEAIGETAAEAGYASDEYSEGARMLARFGVEVEGTTEIVDELPPALVKAQTAMAEAARAAHQASIDFRTDVAAEMNAFVTGFEELPEQVDTTMQEFEDNFTARAEAQAAFWENILALADAGFTDLASELASGGVEMAGIVEDYTDDMEAAAAMDALIGQAEDDIDAMAAAVDNALNRHLPSLSEAFRTWAITAGRAAAMGFSQVDLSSSIDDLVDRATGALQPGRGTGEGPRTPGGAQAFADGGIVQGALGSAQPAIVHGGEEVISIADRRTILSSLDRIASMLNNQGGAGAGTVRILLEGGEDRVLDAQTDSLEATVERLIRR